jgi:hypothetical protein
VVGHEKPPFNQGPTTRDGERAGTGTVPAEQVRACGARRREGHPDRPWAADANQSRQPQCRQARMRKGASVKTDFKAASVLERLGRSLSDADLDYQAGEGVHEFIVRLGGMRHVVDFTDDLMEKKNDKDLTVVILGIVERASLQSLPVHFMVRNDNFDKVMQGLQH